MKPWSYTAIMYSDNISQMRIPHYRPVSSRYIRSEHTIDVLRLNVVRPSTQISLMTFNLAADSSASVRLTERQWCNGVTCNET